MKEHSPWIFTHIVNFEQFHKYQLLSESFCNKEIQNLLKMLTKLKKYTLQCRKMIDIKGNYASKHK